MNYILKTWIGIGMASVALCHTLWAAAPEARVAIASQSYLEPYLESPSDFWAPERRDARVQEFKSLFALMLGDRTYGRWPGHRVSNCVPPLFGFYSDSYWMPRWSDSCQAMIGEANAIFYFSYNPFLHEETVQQIEIAVPGGWPLRAELLKNLNHVLGRPAIVAVKSSGKKPRERWFWKPGIGSAWMYEETVGKKKIPVTRFVWVRPAQAPRLTSPESDVAAGGVRPARSLAAENTRKLTASAGAPS